MIQFALAITIRIINPIINDPELLRFWIDVNHSNPFDNAMRVATVLPQHNLIRSAFVQHRVIKHRIALGHLLDLTFHILLHQSHHDFLAQQVASHRIMIEGFVSDGYHLKI